MKRATVRALPFVVTAALLVLLWRQLQPGALLETLRGASPAWIAVGFLLFAAVNVVRALRFGVLLPRRGLVEEEEVAATRSGRGKPVPIATLLPLSFAVSLLGNTLPLRGSDMSFMVLSRTHVNIAASDATAALAVVRLLDLVAVAAWFVPMTFVVLPQLPPRVDVPITNTPTVAWLVLAALFLVVAAGVIVMLAIWGQRGVQRVAGVANRRGVAKGPLGRRVMAYLENTAKALAAFRDARTLTAALVMSLLSWMLTFVWLYAFAMALGGIAGFGLFVVGATFSVLSKAIPAPTLGGHGVSETGWALGMSLVGWPNAIAITTGLGVSILNLIAVALFGVPSLLWLERSRRQAAGAGP